MGLQPGWPDFLLLAPATADRPGGLVHMLELKRRGEDLGKAQEELAAWCAEQGVPFACYNDLREMPLPSCQPGACSGSGSRDRWPAGAAALPSGLLPARYGPAVTQ